MLCKTLLFLVKERGNRFVCPKISYYLNCLQNSCLTRSKLCFRHTPLCLPLYLNLIDNLFALLGCVNCANKDKYCSSFYKTDFDNTNLLQSQTTFFAKLCFVRPSSLGGNGIHDRLKICDYVKRVYRFKSDSEHKVAYLFFSACLL